MKPTDIIWSNYDKLRSTAPELNCLEGTIKAILEYLDEQAEKPLYACPNCHRIVDELIDHQIEWDGRSETYTPIVQHSYTCKHCAEKK